jgi:PAS domain S-box-containing protein
VLPRPPRAAGDRHEAALHTTLSAAPEHSIDSVSDHSSIARNCSHEHVAFGPDTFYGDHVGFHGVFAQQLDGRSVCPAASQSRLRGGNENPTENFRTSSAGWWRALLDADITAVIGGISSGRCARSGEAAGPGRCDYEGVGLRLGGGGPDPGTATAQAVLASAADPIMAFGADRTTVAWNPAAERVLGWTAAEVLGQPPPIIPAEFHAEHNAVLEQVRDGGQISFATRRIRKDGGALDLRIDASPLLGGGRLAGWVNVCHTSGGVDAARHYMAERARVVRRLGDVVADMNAQLKLEALDWIAASLRELTCADAGGFVLIDGFRSPGQPDVAGRTRGRTADLTAAWSASWMRSGKTVCWLPRNRRPDDLIWSGAARVQ